MEDGTDSEVTQLLFAPIELLLRQEDKPGASGTEELVPIVQSYSWITETNKQNLTETKMRFTCEPS